MNQVLSYQFSGADVAAIGEIFTIRIPIAGTITELQLSSRFGFPNPTDDNIFNFELNDTELFSGSDRLTIASGDESGELTALEIEASENDELAVKVDVLADGGIKTPLTLRIVIDDGLPSETLTAENVQDMIASFLVAGTNVNLAYNDAGNQIVISSTDTNTQLTNEQVQDIVAAFIQQGTNVTVTYDDSGNTLTISAAGGGGGSGGGGVPAGGTTEQILSKIDGTDYNTHWVAKPTGGGGTSGFQKITWTNKINVSEDAHKVLTKTSAGLAWDAGASSLETFKTGIIRFRLKYSDYRVIGFSETDTGAGFADSIKYCLFISGTGYSLYKNGAATSVSGSVSGSAAVFNIFDFEILEDENGTQRVVYLRLNGAIIFQELYDGNATNTLVVDTSMATEGANMGAPMLFKYT